MKKILSFLVVLAMILSCAAIPAMAAISQVGDSIIMDAASLLGTVEYSEAGGTGSWGGDSKIYTNTFWKTRTGSTGVRAYTAGASAKGVTVKFTPMAGKLIAGTYKVEWWNMHGSGSNCAPSGDYIFNVSHNSETATGTFKPSEVADDDWYLLGEYEFTGNGTEYVEIMNNSTSGRFAVDAIQLTLISLSTGDSGDDGGEGEEPPVDEPETQTGVTKDENGTVIIDDDAACFMTGGTDSDGNAVEWSKNTNAKFTDHENDGSPSVTVEGNTNRAKTGAMITVTPAAEILTAGYYDVYWWNLAVGAVTAPTELIGSVTFSGGEKSDSLTFNPQEATTGADWYKLGRYYFSGNGQEGITLSKTVGQNTRFAVDAVKFVPVADSELGAAIRDLYATVTLEGGATQKIAATEKVVNGAKRYYIANVPANAQSYTITCTAATATATVTIDDVPATGTLTTDTENFVTGKADVYEFSIANGAEMNEGIVIFNKGSEVIIDTDAEECALTEDASEETSWYRSTNPIVSGHDGLGGTHCHSGVGASCVWTPVTGKLTAGTYKLEFYNVQNSNGSDGTENVEIEINTANGIKKVNISQKNTAVGWINLGEYSFKGDGTDYVKATKVSEDDGYMRVDAIRFSDPDIIIDEYGIIENGGNYTGVFEGYNLNVKSGVEAKIILAKFNKTTKQLEEVKYEDTATEIKNYIDLSNQGAFTIATPIITAAESDDVMFKVFVWTKGTLAPLYEAKTLSK